MCWGWQKTFEAKVQGALWITLGGQPQIAQAKKGILVSSSATKIFSSNAWKMLPINYLILFFISYRWPSSIATNFLSLNGLFGVFEENGPSFETLHDPKSKSNGVFNASRGTIPTRRSTHGSRRSNLWIDFKILFPKYGEEPQQKSNLKHKWFKQYLSSKAFKQSFSIGAYCR